MAVDEQIAKAWGRVIGKPVRQLLPDEIDPYPAWAWFDGDVPYEIPNPATQPWEWVKAFSGKDFNIGYYARQWQVFIGEELESWRQFVDTPEAALEAAIRAWEAAYVDAK